jgi:hypothetical protein
MAEYGNAVGSALGGVGSSIGGLFGSIGSTLADLVNGAVTSATSAGPILVVGAVAVVLFAVLFLRHAIR